MGPGLVLDSVLYGFFWSWLVMKKIGGGGIRRGVAFRVIIPPIPTLFSILSTLTFALYLWEKYIVIECISMLSQRRNDNQ